MNRIIYACDISYKADINGILELPHQGLGVVIGDGCVIGPNVVIRQNVTIGAKIVDGKPYFPVIGSNVMIGAGAVLLGKINVGDNASIGANAVVLENVLSECTAVGVPAHIIPKNSGSGFMKN